MTVDQARIQSIGLLEALDTDRLLDLEPVLHHAGKHDEAQALLAVRNAIEDALALLSDATLEVSA